MPLPIAMALSFTNPPTSSSVVNNTIVRASSTNSAPGVESRNRLALALFKDTRPRIANRYFATHQNRGKRTVAWRMLVTTRYRNMRPVDRRNPPIPSPSSLNTCTAYPPDECLILPHDRVPRHRESPHATPGSWGLPAPENRCRTGQSSRRPIRRENPPNSNAPFASP